MGGPLLGIRVQGFRGTGKKILSFFLPRFFFGKFWTFRSWKSHFFSQVILKIKKKIKVGRGRGRGFSKLNRLGRNSFRKKKWFYTRYMPFTTSRMVFKSWNSGSNWFYTEYMPFRIKNLLSRAINSGFKWFYTWYMPFRIRNFLRRVFGSWNLILLWTCAIDLAEKGWNSSSLSYKPAEVHARPQRGLGRELSSARQSSRMKRMFVFGSIFSGFRKLRFAERDMMAGITFWNLGWARNWEVISLRAAFLFSASRLLGRRPACVHVR